MIYLFRPYISWRAIGYTIKTLLGTQLAEGKVVRQFEHDFGQTFKKENVLALNSGSSALELAYELAGIGEGDEVITPVLTCTATNIPLLHRRAKIVFADIDTDLNVNVEDVKARITDKTKAIVFVHFGGNNRGLQELVELCASKNIKLIEDAAQVIGSDHWGQGDFTCISLQAIKTLTSGDGGMLICKDFSDYKKAKRLRWFGYDREEKQRVGDTDLIEAGYKYHMNNITASIGLGNLHAIDKVIKHRKELMAIYDLYGLKSNIWMTWGITWDYEKMKKQYAEMGIEIGQHHYRNDKYTIFGGRQTFENMDKYENRYFFVPMHHKITFEQAHLIGQIYQSQ